MRCFPVSPSPQRTGLYIDLEAPIPAPDFGLGSSPTEITPGSSFSVPTRTNSLTSAADKDKFPGILRLTDEALTRSKLIGGPTLDLHDLMIRHRLSWAVMWEIYRSRAVSFKFHFSLKEYASIFPKLAGESNEAARILPYLLAHLARSRKDGGEGPDREEEREVELEEVMRSVKELERPDKDPYTELDKEEEAIRAGNGAGLGLADATRWYGGQGTDSFMYSI